MSDASAIRYAQSLGVILFPGITVPLAVGHKVPIALALLHMWETDRIWHAEQCRSDADPCHPRGPLRFVAAQANRATAAFCCELGARHLASIPCVMD